MLIVLEGTDGAGKTTLSKSLSIDFSLSKLSLSTGWPISRVNQLHKGPPDSRHILTQYEYDLLLYSERIYDQDHLVICDRWHLGEALYGPQLRGFTRLNTAQLTHIEMLLTALGALKVICVASPEELRERWHARQPLNRDETVEMQSLYLKLAVDLGWSIAHPAHVTEMLSYKLLTDASRLCRRAGDLRQFDGYIGSLLPRAILVGDTVGKPVPDGNWVRRAFTPMRYGSAALLLDGLCEIKAYHDIGIVNSRDTDLPALWKATGEPKIIALGQEAAHRCEDSGMKVDSLPHPQYVRRFNRTGWPGYMQKITELIHG